MTVQELIDKLQALGDPDRVVIVARDEEGNGYSTLGDFSIGSYDDSVIIWPGTEYEDAEEAIAASKEQE